MRYWLAAASGLFAVTIFGAVAIAAGDAGQGAPAGPGPGPGPQGGRGGLIAYPPRAPGDPATIERGKTLWGVNCTFCHGPDARGGDGGGPNLLRSSVMLDDQNGELIGPTVQRGRGAMPAIPLTDAQVRDIATFLHSIPVSGTSRAGGESINILVGDVAKGQAFVAQRCVRCHTTAALRAFAGKLNEPKVLQQMWLMPGSGGRGFGPSTAPIPAPPVTAVVTMPSGERVEGEVDRIDDFRITLVLADGQRRTIRTAGTAARVELRDPLQGHKDLLPMYADADIHNVTAYLTSLRNAR